MTISISTICSMTLTITSLNNHRRLTAKRSFLLRLPLLRKLSAGLKERRILRGHFLSLRLLLRKTFLPTVLGTTQRSSRCVCVGADIIRPLKFALILRAIRESPLRF